MELANSITLTSGDSGDDTFQVLFLVPGLSKLVRTLTFSTNNTYTGDTTITQEL